MALSKSLVTLFGFVAVAASLSAAERKPNILLIYSDDHGWADLGAQGVNAEIRTPHLDQLARDGVRFARGYVSAPQCVPSRAGLLTGRYQQRFGVEDNGKGPLPLSELTIAERLKPAGYRTGQVGKWHLDLGPKVAGTRAQRAIPEHLPHGQGFDEYWRGELRQFFASHDLKGQPFADAPRLVTDNRFRVVVQTEAALAFLERRTAQPEQPWFLYLAWYAPHVPLESPEPWFSRTSAELPLPRRQALAMIAAMDDGLGQIRAKLRAMGAEKDTLIFFISDNGAPLGNAWDGSLNAPLVGQKGMLSEGGIRVPFVAAWPGTLPAGTTCDQPVISFDVAATAVALAGLPADAQLDGVNLIPFLTGETKAAPHETLYWRWGSQAAVLEMPYKLVALGDRERLLFDVTKPDGENAARNLARQQPELAARLETKLKAWAATLQPPGLPTSLDPHHEGLFGEHDIIPKTATPTPARKGEPEGSIQGWIARNATLAVEDGALRVKATATGRQRAFLVRTGLAVPGPVTATITLRVPKGGSLDFAWRLAKQSDFAADQVASAPLAASPEWQTITVPLNRAASLMHLRILLPEGDIAVGEIRLAGDNESAAQRWSFE